MAIVLLAPQRIVLSETTPRVRSSVVPVSTLTSELHLVLRRPTSASPLLWTTDASLQASLVLLVDGVPYPATTIWTGGIRRHRLGHEVPESRFTYQPLVGLHTRAREYLRTAVRDAEGYAQDVPLTRLGEMGATVEAYVQLDWRSGVIQTEILLAQAWDAPAPILSRYKNSVAFDAVSSVTATNVNSIAVSHTNVGTTNLAAYAGVGCSDGTPRSTTNVTYGATGMTELWDTQFQSFFHNSGHALVAPATGAQTVTADIEDTGATTDELTLGVMTLTGVHQTTPTNTVPVLATGSSTTATSNAVTSAVDELVVGHCYSGWAAAAAGAGETERWDVNVGGATNSWGATEPGAASVTFSCTRSTAGSGTQWGINAVSFIAAAAGGRTTKNTRSWPLGVETGMGFRMPT